MAIHPTYDRKSLFTSRLVSVISLAVLFLSCGCQQNSAATETPKTPLHTLTFLPLHPLHSLPSPTANPRTGQIPISEEAINQTMDALTAAYRDGDVPKIMNYMDPTAGITVTYHTSKKTGKLTYDMVEFQKWLSVSLPQTSRYRCITKIDHIDILQKNSRAVVKTSSHKQVTVKGIDYDYFTYETTSLMMSKDRAIVKSVESVQYINVPSPQKFSENFP